MKSQENRFYDEAYLTIDNMLNDKQKYSFKVAVLTTENAYYQGKLDTVEVNRKIKFMANFCKTILRNRELTYNETDKDKLVNMRRFFQLYVKRHLF